MPLVRTLRNTINIIHFVEISEVYAESYIIRRDIKRIGSAYRHGKCGVVDVYARRYKARVAVAGVCDNFTAFI
jgi:hypothetical protein